MEVARAASDCDVMGCGTRDTALTQLATTSANDVSPSSRNARVSNRASPLRVPTPHVARAHAAPSIMTPAVQKLPISTVRHAAAALHQEEGRCAVLRRR